MTHSVIAFAGAVVLGAIAGSLADWLFAGVLFHDRYQRHPGTWRAGVGETSRIVLAQALTLCTCDAMVAMMLLFSVSNLSEALGLATLVWLAGPLPLLLANHLFINVDGAITFSHALGWFVKLNLAAAIALFLLR